MDLDTLNGLMAWMIWIFGEYGGFQKWGYPIAEWFWREKFHLEMDANQGYTYFRNPPFISHLSPKISFVSHRQPSILGYLHLWKPPLGETCHPASAPLSRDTGNSQERPMLRGHSRRAGHLLRSVAPPPVRCVPWMVYIVTKGISKGW